MHLKEIVRKVLSLYYREGKSYKILFGASKGKKMVYRKDVNYMEIMGLWERSSFEVLNKIFVMPAFAKPICVADVGANLGFYEIYFSTKLHKESTIFAFEPSETVLDLLKKNLIINNLTNVTVVESACSNRSGDQIFYIGKNHHLSSFFPEHAGGLKLGKVVISTVSMDDYFSQIGMYPDFIKMDIEGAAVFALEGCNICFTAKRPIVLIESHSAAEDTAIGKHLKKHKYAAYRITTKKWVKNVMENYKDPDGVWGSMLLIPEEQRSQFNF